MDRTFLFPFAKRADQLCGPPSLLTQWIGRAQPSGREADHSAPSTGEVALYGLVLSLHTDSI